MKYNCWMTHFPKIEAWTLWSDTSWFNIPLWEQDENYSWWAWEYKKLTLSFNELACLLNSCRNLKTVFLVKENIIWMAGIAKYKTFPCPVSQCTLKGDLEGGGNGEKIVFKRQTNILPLTGQNNQIFTPLCLLVVLIEHKAKAPSDVGEWLGDVNTNIPSAFPLTIIIDLLEMEIKQGIPWAAEHLLQGFELDQWCSTLWFHRLADWQRTDPWAGSSTRWACEWNLIYWPGPTCQICCACQPDPMYQPQNDHICQIQPQSNPMCRPHHALAWSNMEGHVIWPLVLPMSLEIRWQEAAINIASAALLPNFHIHVETYRPDTMTSQARSGP